MQISPRSTDRAAAHALVHARGRSGAPRVVLVIALALASLALEGVAATLTRGPYLQSGTPSGVTLRWRTDTPTDSVVRYGEAPGALAFSASVAGSTTEHTVVIEGLASDTRYYYSVGSSEGSIAGDDAAHHFDTSPPTGTASPTRIWALGDSGTADRRARAVRDAFYGYAGDADVDLMLMLGDNAYDDGTDAEYQKAVFEMYDALLPRTVLWPAIGNHERVGAYPVAQPAPYFEIFTLPAAGEAGGTPSGTEAYYSFDYANIHFVVLDSQRSDRSVAGAMHGWLETDLANTVQPWIIALWHHPPYSKGSHDSDDLRRLSEMRENFLPLLESYGVDLVLAGHSHSYERSYLIDGHYGRSTTFDASMLLDGGDGGEPGDGAYTKVPNTANSGAVYVVAGSSGKTSRKGRLDHPVMHASIRKLGSMVIDVDGNRLDARFLRENGTVADTFTLIKGEDTTAPNLLGAIARSATLVELAFNETLDPASARTAANYTLGNGARVDSATLLASGREVSLAVSPLTAELDYIVTVRGVADEGGNTAGAEGVSTSFRWSENAAPAAGDDAAATSGGVAVIVDVVANDTDADADLDAGSARVADCLGACAGPANGTLTNLGDGLFEYAPNDGFDGGDDFVYEVCDTRGLCDTASVAITVVPVGGARTVEVRVSSGADDAEERASGWVARRSSDLELVRDGDRGEQTVGMRFKGLAVPAGATVRRAWIQFTVDEVEANEPANLDIRGEAVADAAPFRGRNGNVSSRAVTDAVVSWSVAHWPRVGERGARQRTPNIAAVIQEVIDRPAWAPGQALVVLMEGSGQRTAESHDGSAVDAPSLHVEYTSP